ncbi:CheR family methyltransferase [Archangium lansingense]|uniref:Protein-glutamate O-methyltransferase CheR n=1 Tax=Archangium lansingense TaxID=2995310 RepID=A0ABT4A552_9BACT|nr:protein-glutamate O-methyltransferase CheR [Archangium lansinium]MCY1076087.1 protein-glutamate O-methyltransferase CheR [Archangium lansinium]
MKEALVREAVEGEDALEDIELDLLLEGVVRRYGLDFRGYARMSLRRRVWNMVHAQKLGTLSALQAKVLHEPLAMEELLQHLSVNTTTMFRDPSFFSAFREKVVPHLFSAPFVRIWHAGCSTGEEVYSLAILLTEAGLYERSRIYATDMNAAVVERAKSGIFPMEHMREYTANYLRAGGTAAFSDYYTANYDHAIFKASLRKNIVFAQHNLVSDGTFNEFNVILCRNVLIYFGTDLQSRVYRLLDQSLRRFGILALGRGETLRHTVIENDYDEVDMQERLYRRRA